jgi:hypothetical protein
MHAETLYGQTPNLLEDTLNFTDGELGVLDEATADFLTTWPDYKTELAAAGIAKNKRITHASIPGIFFLKSLRPQVEGSSRAITTLSMVGILAEPWEEWQERRLREISAFGQVVSIGPVEKTILAISETEKGEEPGVSGVLERVWG